MEKNYPQKPTTQKKTPQNLSNNSADHESIRDYSNLKKSEPPTGRTHSLIENSLAANHEPPGLLEKLD